MTLEVLVATTKQVDFSLVKKMNLTCSAVIANQNDTNSYSSIDYDGNHFQMITTDTKGVGKNRNIALAFSSADILLFADDDVVYNQGFDKNVIASFEKFPKADVIVFGMDLTKEGEVYNRVRGRDKILNRWNALHYGTYVIAIKRKAVLTSNLHFSELFGGGCVFSSGEDSLFLLDCFRKKLKVFSASYVLGNNPKDVSTWFTGYNKKYFYDKGAWIAAAFPQMRFFLIRYFAIRHSRLTKLSYREMIKEMEKGAKNYKSIVPFIGEGK